ncbi:MAG: hypothetical protein AAFQ74_06005 [Cyanobacteria bacterium J06623_4]
MFRLFRWVFNLFGRSPDQTPQDAPPALPERPASGRPLSDRPGSDSSPSDEPESDSPAPENLPSSVPEMPTPANTRSRSVQNTSLEELKQVLNVLRAYIVTFGEPDSELTLRAVVGAVVANVKTVEVENRRLEAFIDDAIAAYESLGNDASLVDVSAQLLAEQVSVWLQEQESIVNNVVSAYLQQFAPEDKTWEPGDLLNLVQTVVATLNDGSLSKSGGRSLIQRVMGSFVMERALSRWVAPEWVALAQRVASYEDNRAVQQDLQSIAWSYIQQFQAILSPQLIEQIAEQGPINVSPAEFLSGDLGAFSEMLFYKFQLLAADPVVTKTHEDIAAQVNRAIADFKDRREPGLDVTEGLPTGELEVSSPFFRTDSSQGN